MVKFERYVDDVVLHCFTGKQARYVQNRIASRLVECGLRMHPEKTQIVYCRDHRRRDSYPVVSFDFLGFGFQPRMVKTVGAEIKLGFGPAISRRARKHITQVCRTWRLGDLVSLSLRDLACRINPVVRGWYVYYSKFYPSLCSHALCVVNFHLRKWLRRKYKRYSSKTQATRALQRICRREPSLFFHWSVGITN